jgi:uncharacterized damage-inducible protein DinB
MSDMMAKRYRRWFEYEKDAHAKVVRSLETVPVDRRPTPEFRRAVAILDHIVAARRVWLYRLGLVEGEAPPFFRENPELAEVVSTLRIAEDRWVDYLSRITDEDLDRVFEYQSWDGGRFRNQIADVLTQLFGHSWYHRGQIAMLVRIAGGEPAVTDLIYWCREPVVPS